MKNFMLLYNSILLLLLSVFVLPLQAQQAQTDFARNFSSACGQAGNVSFTIGQPFFQQITNDSGLEMAEGVQQAQILYNNIVMEGCQNDPDLPTIKSTTGFFQGFDNTMTFNGATLHVLPAGHYDSTDVNSRHYSWNGPYNYDSVTTLVLDVWPIYEVDDTLRLDISALGDFQEGDNPENDRYLHTIHDCDSLVHYYVLTCGEEITDADNNNYQTLFVGRYCWTQQNLRPEHYVGGAPIANTMVYVSPEHPNEAENLDQYGRLYSWYSAVNVPENSANMPATDLNGFVQGLCPAGWHIPTERNMASLNEVGTPALKSTILWLNPGNNSSRFTAYPAGFYNPTPDRFENLLGETRYWTSAMTSAGNAQSGVLSNLCDEVLMDAQAKNSGFSVRCVKNQ